jgi:DNA-binding transcriptional ArsR family regulator
MDQNELIQVVRSINRATDKPARTLAIAIRMAASERTVRWHLARLEAMGLVERPDGRCSGWVATVDRFTEIRWQERVKRLLDTDLLTARQRAFARVYIMSAGDMEAALHYAADGAKRLELGYVRLLAG